MAETAPQPLTLAVGDRVVYPNQGVCRVTSVESKEVAGQTLAGHVAYADGLMQVNLRLDQSPGVLQQRRVLLERGTQQRLRELNSHPSLLNPLWYAGAFAIGAVAGVLLAVVPGDQEIDQRERRPVLG